MEISRSAVIELMTCCTPLRSFFRWRYQGGPGEGTTRATKKLQVKEGGTFFERVGTHFCGFRRCRTTSAA